MNRRNFFALTFLAPFAPRLTRLISPPPIFKKVVITWNDIVRSTTPMWRSAQPRIPKSAIPDKFLPPYGP